MTLELTVVDDASAAADAAAVLLVEAARAGGAVGLSGGSTPRVAYERAAALEADWSTATLWLVDERCVLPEDPLANTRLVRETILERVASPPRFHEIATHVGVEGAADRYDALLRRDGVPPLLFLGVGSDGHTASLFPDAPSLAEGERLAVAADAGMEPFVPRITMTLAAIGAAEHVVFLVTGEDRAERVRQAFASPPTPAIPASLARSASGRTTVIVDRGAASRL
jgi:6-phosphogluconolactonase